MELMGATIKPPTIKKFYTKGDFYLCTKQTADRL